MLTNNDSGKSLLVCLVCLALLFYAFMFFSFQHIFTQISQTNHTWSSAMSSNSCLTTKPKSPQEMLKKKNSTSSTPSYLVHKTQFLAKENIFQFFKSAEQLNKVGYEHYQKGEFNKAIMAFEQAISNDPNYVDAYYNLGVVLWCDLRDYQKAEHYFRKFLDLGSNIERIKVVENLLKKKNIRKNLQHYAANFSSAKVDNLDNNLWKRGLLVKTAWVKTESKPLPPSDKTPIVISRRRDEEDVTYPEEDYKSQLQEAEKLQRYNKDLQAIFLLSKLREEAQKKGLPVTQKKAISVNYPTYDRQQQVFSPNSRSLEPFNTLQRFEQMELERSKRQFEQKMMLEEMEMKRRKRGLEQQVRDFEFEKMKQNLPQNSGQVNIGSNPMDPFSRPHVIRVDQLNQSGSFHNAPDLHRYYNKY